MSSVTTGNSYTRTPPSVITEGRTGIYRRVTQTGINGLGEQEMRTSRHALPSHPPHPHRPQHACTAILQNPCAHSSHGIYNTRLGGGGVRSRDFEKPVKNSLNSPCCPRAIGDTVLKIQRESASLRTFPSLQCCFSVQNFSYF